MTWTLHHGSCLDALSGLASLADKSVDVTITDPPYDEHTHKAGRRGNSIAAKRGAIEGRSAARHAATNRSRDLGFRPITQFEMAESSTQFARVTRRWVLVFCTFEMVGDRNGIGWRGHLERAGLDYVRTCIWHKPGSTPQFTGDRPAQAAEAIAWASQPHHMPDLWPEAILVAHPKGRKRWNGHGKHGYYSHSIVLERGHGEVRCHTTQKPLALMSELVADFTEPGDLVLDAFAGSGSTGIACSQLGRDFIGWELSAEYHAIAQRRLRGEGGRINPAQPDLFEVRS